ncbi:sporulation-delaying protein SdpB family protein [Pseudarthrobacter equi]|uniref:sporulation-delaying protein SdpB family protein n=1 Tax=Pseudarthrobacter equi TaxID=728066 RepID=UPI000B827AA3|nr:sporulation-delaying protein SdpB family protein [Pseudarthrobacter equi]
MHLTYFGLQPSGQPPALWSPIVGLVRSLLAFASFLTLLTTPSTSLFQPLWGLGMQPVCVGVNSLNWFCLFGTEPWSKLLACAVLVIVMSGYVPQVTAFLHYWISFSLFNGIAVPDGGDQITAVLTLLLIPLCITDPRLNHWSPAKEVPDRSKWRRGWALAAVLGIKVQMSVLYLQSCIEKTSQTEWATGNNLYYTASGVFGFSDPVRDLLGPLLENAFGVSLLTWSVLVLEFALAITLLTPPQWRPYLFLLAALFHAGIAIFMGLWSFAIAMVAADLLLTLPLTANAFAPGVALRPFLNRQQAQGHTEQVSVGSP